MFIKFRYNLFIRVDYVHLPKTRFHFSMETPLEIDKSLFTIFGAIDTIYHSLSLFRKLSMLFVPSGKSPRFWECMELAKLKNVIRRFILRRGSRRVGWGTKFRMI